jgi:thiol-disulfide isomerase/thioredoxin
VKGNVQAELKDGKFPLTAELAGISGYLNTDGEEIKISDFRGKVVLVDFWTYTCINCIRTLPFLTEWDVKYKDKGLVIIGVHTPEFEFEKKKENVEVAMEKYGIEYRVVQDNDYATWRNFENRFWPHKYLIDSEGYVRYDHIGEGGYEETELKIQELLAEIGEDVSDKGVVDGGNGVRFQTTPELYAGLGFALSRGQIYGNLPTEDFEVGEVFEYDLPETGLRENTIYLEGLWIANENELIFAGESGSVWLDFTASEVNIVVEPLEGDLFMEVLVDGEYVTEANAGNDVVVSDDSSSVFIDKALLYNVYDGEYINGVLELKVGKGFSFNAFTFG